MAINRTHLFIDAQHGLSNRLRAIASAAVIAEATDRQLVIVWRPDHHCEARLQDLFDYLGPVLEDESAEFFRENSVRSYNYMEIEPDSNHGEPILADGDISGDVYIRSAYSLNSPLCSMPAEQIFLRKLVPSQAVWTLVDSVTHPSDIAAHIRIATGPAFEHLPFESSVNWPMERHQELVEWRRKSDVSRFATRLAQLFDQGARHAFIAADVPETYAALQDRFGKRLRTLERQTFDRSPQQLQFALADLLLLTSAPRLLASSWSSFSDMAQRLARPFHTVERSGVDF